MSNGVSGIINTGLESWREGTEILERLLGRAGVQSAFSEPVSQGDYTVVTASESTVAIGFGCGSGGGATASVPAGPLSAGPLSAGPLSASDEESDELAMGHGDKGGGGGGGAGGTSVSRPVAAISIGPNGVSVEPIVDPTKIALAFFTMLGAFLIMLGRMRRAADE